MYITVEEALLLPTMAEAVLLAGKKGLDKKIRSVNIMEVPDISRFIQAEEVLITTLYPIIDDEVMQQSLVKTLVEKEVSALLIAPLSAEREIPSIMLKHAEELDLPLIQLPVDTAFNKILNPILEAIFERKHMETEYRFRSSVIRDVLQGKSISKAQILSLSKYYGWDLDSAFVPAVMLSEFEKSSDFYFRNLMDIARRSDLKGTIVSESDDGIILLFPQAKIRDNIEKFLKPFTTAYPKATFGIGPVLTDMTDLPDSISKARRAITISKKVRTDNQIAAFDQLGIYRVLFDGFDQAFMEQSLKNKREFLNEKLGSIIDYDKENKAQLLETLEIYFAERENIKTAAKRMFIHYNTMRYRLNQIEEIAKLSLDDAETLLELKIALKIADLL